MGAGCWQLRDICADSDHRCPGSAGDSTLEGLLLALPDGCECVATSGPQVVFIPFGVLPPLLGSSAEPDILELATVLTVKQAAMELEHCSCVRMIAAHGQVPHAQWHLRPVGGMQQALQLVGFCLVGQPLEGGPAMAWPISVGHALGIQAIVWLALDLAGPDGHFLCHGPGLKLISTKTNQGATGERLGTILSCPHSSEANLCVEGPPMIAVFISSARSAWFAPNMWNRPLDPRMP